MNRQEKIEYIRQLAAGKLAPGDLLRQLPVREESWFHTLGKDMFTGQGMALTREELDNYRNPYPGPIRRTVYVIRRASGHRRADEEANRTAIQNKIH